MMHNGKLLAKLKRMGNNVIIMGGYEVGLWRYYSKLN